MTIDDATIRDLIGFTDERGVLSFYAGHTPAKAADPQPTTPIEIRNQIKQLQARLAETDPPLAKAVDDRLRTIAGALGGLLDPKASGRGRALFVGIASGDTTSLALQIPFRERVVLHDSPYVRPLVAAHDEGRAAGVLVVSRAGARLFQWAVGEAVVLEDRSFEVKDSWLADEKAGPSPGMPQHPHHGFVDRDRFEDRVDDNRHRFLREFVDDAIVISKRQGWDRLVLSGSPKQRDEVKELLEAVNGLRVLIADASWEDAAPHVVAEQAWPLLRSVHRDRENQLVASALERTLAGGAGTLGLRGVCDALNEGRVAHLLYDDDLSLQGYRSEEGTLHPRAEGAVAASEVPLRAEPLFIERMIEAAIATGALVTPVGNDAAEQLAPYEGVGALLRW